MPRPSWPADVEHDAPALARRPRSSAASQLRAAVAAQRAEDVAGEALGVHPDQHVLAVADVAADERDVLACRRADCVADRAERAVAQSGSAASATRSTGFSKRRR